MGTGTIFHDYGKWCLSPGVLISERFPDLVDGAGQGILSYRLLGHDEREDLRAIHVDAGSRREVAASPEVTDDRGSSESGCDDRRERPEGKPFT